MSLYNPLGDVNCQIKFPGSSDDFLTMPIVFAEKDVAS